METIVYILHRGDNFKKASLGRRKRNSPGNMETGPGNSRKMSDKYRIGSLRNEDGDGNENATKQWA